MLRAARDYENRLQLLRKLVQLDASFDNQFGITKRQHLKAVEAIRASLALLPVAFFEEFLRSLAAQCIDLVNNKTPRLPWNLLPEKLRKAHVFDTPPILRSKRIPGESYNTHETRVLADIANITSIIVSPSVAPANYTVAAETFVQVHNNPDADRVNEIFSRLGCTDVFRRSALVKRMQSLDPALSTGDAVRLRLDAIVQRRHAIAHGRPLGGLVRQDLDRDIDFLQRLARALQVVAGDHFRKLLK